MRALGKSGLLLFTAVWAACSPGPYTREELRERHYYETIPTSVETHDVDVNGQRIHYLEQGLGQSVVLIHGFPTHTYVWRHVLPRLAKGFHVYALDLPGYGKSPLPANGPQSLSQHTEHVAAWMDELGLSRAIVVGQGFGGGVAQALAIRHPEKVGGLVLINSVCYDSWPNQYASLWAEPGWGSVIGFFNTRKTGFRNLLMQGVYHQVLISDGVFANYYEPWEGDSGRRRLIDTAESFDPRETELLARELSKIRVPTLVIAGRFDPFQSINYSKRLAADIPGAEFVPIAQCGHFASEDESEIIVRYVQDYFGQRSPI